MNPRLKEFIDRVIVPALVEQFLREQATRVPVSIPQQSNAEKPAPVEEVTP